MNELYLVINGGSSSLKFSLYKMPNSKELVSGCVEKIGNEDSSYTLKFEGKKVSKEKVIKNHAEAVKIMLDELIYFGFIKDLDEIKGIGHRILHGGEYYSESTYIDEEVLNNIKELSKFGPLHHPGEIAGIEAMEKVLPNVPQVAVFDTAFHQTIEKENYLYAVPYNWYKENGVRKYGFHGTSHKYITEVMQDYFHKKDVNLIICHIGNGASLCCVKNGLSHNTSMGLTPLDGLIMGTRSGSIDSSLIEFICKERNLSVEEVTSALNKESGLLGISGKNDFRDVDSLRQKGDENAILALNMFRDAIVKYIAQYYFELKGSVDAIVFTAGIGENSASLRESVINDIKDVMNIELNNEANNNMGGRSSVKCGLISGNNSKIPVLVIPTNEEYMILKDTYNITKELENENTKKLSK